MPGDRDEDDVVDALLRHAGIVDMGRAWIMDVEGVGEWAARVELDSGGSFTLPARATRGQAVDALDKWAKDRRLVLTWDACVLRRLLPEEARHAG